MAATFEALAIILVFVLPGAAYTWSFERHVGAFGIGAVDRGLRFISASLIVRLTFGWLEYLTWRLVIAGHEFKAAQFAALWGILIVLTTVPALLGLGHRSFVGISESTEKSPETPEVPPPPWAAGSRT